jgi:predicted Zn-dependent protease
MERIKRLLSEAGISDYIVYGYTERTAELFFVKKQLDTRRIKDVEKFVVTVYRTGEKDGEKLRAATDVTLLAAMTDEEIGKALRDTYYAAQFAMNPYYELPDPVTAPTVEAHGRLMEQAPELSAGEMAAALFKADCEADAFLNSAEIFVIQKHAHIVSSRGTDVSWTEAEVKGEYVVQAKEPEDVEMYRDFAYTELNTEALAAQAKEALQFVRDRARAQKILKSGNYDVILTGENVMMTLWFYGDRSAAHMIYPGYSTWKVGDDVQGETVGERITLTMRALAPYSREGIPMRDRKLLESGVMQSTHGPNRFCRYLGVEPTGDYRKFSCDNPGTMSFAEMRKRPCLWAVTFSGFEMDAFSGHFGGEIRLAYLIEDGKMTPVTGGSINGSILEAQKDIVFSTDRYAEIGYDGPYALLLKNIPVAGTDDAE